MGLTEYRINQEDRHGDIIDMDHRDELEAAKEVAVSGPWVDEAVAYSIERLDWNDKGTGFVQELVVESTNYN